MAIPVLAFLAGSVLSAGVEAKEPVSAATSPSAQAAERPKLVVAITVDGLRADTLTRFADQIGEGGFKRLMQSGTWFTNARFSHQTTYTAVGHSVILSGTHPYQSGMVANDWHDRTLNDQMYCVEDRDSPYVGEPTKMHMGTSPRNFNGSTVGDELLMSNNFMSKVVSVSNKDRGAILTGGWLGKSYWWSCNHTGWYVTSTYYMKDYPEWHKKWHEKKLPDQYFNCERKKMLPEEAYRPVC
jgi:predicted AlkP superfamily pyrophosphatase or phosphodiesterase